MNPPKELKANCKLLGIKWEKQFIFNFMGHEVDLSNCGTSPVSIFACIAEQLALKLTEVYLGNIEKLFEIPKQK